jgi:flagellar basal body-associated protein FliL
MENININNEVFEHTSKHHHKVMTTFISRLIAAGVSIITFCASLMVYFVWDMKSDFATEKEKNQQTYQSVIEIKADVKAMANDVQDTKLEVQLLKQSSSSFDLRLQNIERK